MHDCVGKGASEPSEEAVAESSSNLDAAETVHPEHEATNVEIQGNDVMREMEEEEMVQEGDEGSVVKVRRLARVNPYEGLPVPEEFPGGPLDTSVLYDYGAPHIERCVYDNKDRGMIMPVSNEGKMNSIVYFVNDFKWWHTTMDTIGMYRLELTGYSFLDPTLLSTFVERWHGETNSFHMSSGGMIVTLDDMCCLPIKGRLLDHK
ncbi:putative IMP dehydrogenase/GMP reductase, partial [Trifolium pratense]